MCVNTQFTADNSSQFFLFQVRKYVCTHYVHRAKIRRTRNAKRINTRKEKIKSKIKINTRKRKEDEENKRHTMYSLCSCIFSKEAQRVKKKNKKNIIEERKKKKKFGNVA